MGIDTALRTLLKESVSGVSWRTGPPSDLEKLVVVDDLLTRLFTMIGPNKNYMFTGLQLYASIMRPVRELLKSKHGYVYVLLCDDPEFVPAEKADEQKQRDSDSRTQPYDIDKGLSLCDEGLKEQGKEQAEMFDVRRFVRTRSLRSKLCDYVATLFGNNEHVPDDKTFIMDYQGAKEPQVWGKPLPSGVSSKPHKHGESDPSMMYWALQFKDHPILLETTDSDIMPLCACLARKTDTSELRVWWRYDRKITVDLVQLLKRSFKTYGLTAKQFALLCILTGTDFFDKKPVYHGFGPKKLVVAMQATQKYWAKFGDSSSDSDANDDCIMRQFVFALYAHLLPTPHMESYLSTGAKLTDDIPSIDWDKVLTDLRPRCPKAYHPPDKSAITHASKRVRFNHDYWMRFDATIAKA